MNAKVEPDAIRPAPWWLFVLLLAATVLMIVLGNQWYAPSGLWKPLYERSQGLVDPTLLWGLASFILVVCGVLLGAGRRRPAELGIDLHKIPAALIYTCVVWILVQVVLGVCYIGIGKSPDIANSWDGVNVLRTVGEFLGQLFGNAVYEEVVFRGFLLMQCLLLFRVLWPNRPSRALVAALGLAAAIFAVNHLPYHLRPDNYVSLSNLAWRQAEMILWGCVLGWIYWQTRNLSFVVGVHALANAPMTLFAWHNLGPLTRTDPVVLLIGIGTAAAWQRRPATDR